MKHAKYILEIKVNDKDVDKYTDMFEESMNEMLARDDCPEVYECYTKMKIVGIEDAEVEKMTKREALDNINSTIDQIRECCKNVNDDLDASYVANGVEAWLDQLRSDVRVYEDAED